MVIAVDGIRLNEMEIVLPQNVSGINMETGKDIKEGGLTPVSMITIRAKAPAGKKFSMWNDGKAVTLVLSQQGMRSSCYRYLSLLRMMLQ